MATNLDPGRSFLPVKVYVLITIALPTVPKTKMNTYTPMETISCDVNGDLQDRGGSIGSDSRSKKNQLNHSVFTK